jgi:hypothetical protein
LVINTDNHAAIGQRENEGEAIMTDPVTKRRVQVYPAPEVGPWFIVRVSMIPEVQAMLDKNNVRYELDDSIVTINGQPPTRKINLARGTDPDVVQRLLDGVQ